MWSSYFGIKRYFYIQNLAFIALGIDVTSVKRTFRNPPLTILFCLSQVVMLCSWIYRCSLFINDEVEVFADAVIPIFQGFTCTWKYFTYMYKRRDIRNLIQHIWLTTEKANSEELSIIAAENKKDKVFSSIYFIVFSMQIFNIAVMPQIMTFVFYMKTSQIHLYIPMELSTPFDQHQPIYYLLTTFWYFCGIYSFAYATVAMDVLYSWLVHNISAQFRTLKLQLRDAAQEPLVTKTEAAVIRFIRKHQQTIALTDDFDRIFQPILFVEFLLNGLQLCFLAFRFSRGVSLEKIPFLTVFMGGVTFQLMIYSYGGQRIQDESQNICTYIYEIFSWHIVPIRAKKLLMLSILRAQKCCSLTGVFFTANWLIFVWVFSKAFSFLTLLLTLVEKE